jgi:hypothetical protein
MIGYQVGSDDNSLMPMPVSRTPTGARSSKEVETVRIFTASGHPWIGFAALVVWRAPPILFVAVLLAKHLLA